MTEKIIYDGERLDEINESLRLIQKTNGLTFGTDAYLLAAFMKGAKNASALELGSGTGIISLLCAAKGKFKEIYALELQKDFAELCKRNAVLNGLEEKVFSVCADVRNVKPEDFGKELDVVFSNPPYMKTDSGKRNEAEEKYIARHEVCGGIDDFCHAATRLLKFGGIFYCVYRPDRITDLFAAMKKHKLEPKRMTFVCADAETAPSMVLIEAKKGGSCGLKVTRPLFLHKCDENKGGKRSKSPDAEKIYDTCSFETF